MKQCIQRLSTNLRVALLAGAVVVASSSLAFSRLGDQLEADKPELRPVKLVVDDSPISRESGTVTSFAPVVKKVTPSVVNVFTSTRPRNASADSLPFDNPFFRRFFGENFQFRAPRQRGLGSGVIVSDDGYILTNNHVVENADQVRVALANGDEFAAKIVGTDPKTDIAVLKIDGEKLPQVALGDSDQIEVGDVVLAIGNPFGVGQTVTMGIVSATGRASMGLDLEYEDFIQTDAAINPGNSGGPLVDAKGRVVGINTAIVSRSGGNNGIGFAVPINMARNVMESLIEHGRVARGYLGVYIQDLSGSLAQEFGLDDAKGALVGDVIPGSPAARAGVRAGDIILSLNGKPVTDSRHLKLRIGELDPGEKVELELARDGERQTLTLELEETPGENTVASRGAQSGDSGETLVGVTVMDLDREIRRQLDLPRDIEGALVADVDPASAAYEAGLRQGDVILEINHHKITSAADAVELTNNSTDKTVLLRVWSRGASRYLVVDESKAS